MPSIASETSSFFPIRRRQFSWAAVPVSQDRLAQPGSGRRRTVRRARRRALEIANDADLRIRAPRKKPQDPEAFLKFAEKLPKPLDARLIDEGSTVMVLFSVVNPQAQPVEVLAPQIQLAGKVCKGFIFRHSRWGTSVQLPVQDFRLSRRKLADGTRADGVAVFTRPSFKQSNESVFLQIAGSGAVDKPALAPIGFGVSTIKEESHGQ